MGVEVSTDELLLDSLMENSNIKAALVLDERGYIIEKRGSAKCIDAVGDDDKTQIIDTNAEKKQPTESLYLVEAGDDFLVVVFDDKLNFEHLKKSVDSSLAHFGFRPDADADDD